MSRDRIITDATDRQSADTSVTRELVGQNVPTDFSIAPVGIEDIDRAVFEIFDKQIKHEIFVDGEPILNDGPGNVQRVPVIFATGERFALVKRKRPVRDKNGQIILPLISIRRTGFEQGVGFGRGVAQDTGGFKIKRRLSKSDRKYQLVLNKLGIKNQDNLANDKNFGDFHNKKDSRPDRIASRRRQKSSVRVHSGNLFNTELHNNIFEVIEIPFPQFYDVKYEIMYWSQYTQHMNIMLEQLFSAYRAQGNQFKLTTDKGYYFIGFIGDSISPQDNFQDFSNEERIIRHSFEITVPGYLIAPKNPGDMVSLRSYMSAPQINFEMFELKPSRVPVQREKRSAVGTGDIDKFTLSDVYAMDKHGNIIDENRFEPQYTRVSYVDPVTSEKKSKLVRVKDRNQRKGETIIDASELIDMDEFS